MLTIGGIAVACGVAGCGSSGAGAQSRPRPPARSTHSVQGTRPPSGPTHRPSPAPAATVTIQNFAYREPKSVAPGAVVAVKNMDQIAHTVTANRGHLFDVEVDPGHTARFVAPDKPGTYRFHCEFHSTMHGTLTVE